MAIPDRGPELLGVNIAFLATAVVANALRCYVRLRMVKAFGLDDWLMVGSTVRLPSLPQHATLLISTSYSLLDT
jgi:hypothetical protein